jgi:hypothetical protein
VRGQQDQEQQCEGDPSSSPRVVERHATGAAG